MYSMVLSIIPDSIVVDSPNNMKKHLEMSSPANLTLGCEL
jgi:hypothetical protein